MNAAILAAFAFGALAPGARAAVCDRCNIVLINALPLRADAVAPWGGDPKVTPHIERLVSSGTVFRNAFSQSGGSLSSYAAMTTGFYPENLGVYEPYLDVLPPGTTALATLFRRAGYRTFWVSTEDATLEPDATRAEGFDERFAPTPGIPEAAWESVRRSSEPFFLFYLNIEMHAPIVPSTATYRRLYGEDSPVESEEFRREIRRLLLDEPRRVLLDEALSRYPDILSGRSDEARLAALRKALAEPALRHTSVTQFASKVLVERLERGRGRGELRRLYDAVVAEFDAEVGAIEAKLREAGVAGRTLVFFASQHGQEFWDRGRFGHSHLYPETTHVPLAGWGPGLRRGRVIDDVVQLVDLYPTLLELTGLAVPPRVDGRSLAPLLTGRGSWRSRPAYSSFRTSYVVRDERFSFFRYVPDPDDPDARGPVIELLYDRINDPGEFQNVLPSKPKEAAAMSRRLSEHLRGARGAAPLPAGLDPRLRRQLLDTGYW